MKITLAEWQEFISAWDELPGHGNWYMDDQDIPGEDGCPSIGASETFELTGFLDWQGEGDYVNNCLSFLGPWTLETAVKKWRKLRDFDVLFITAPKGRTEAVRAAVKALGCKVSVS
jgi:hypothetical protein